MSQPARARANPSFRLLFRRLTIRGLSLVFQLINLKLAQRPLGSSAFTDGQVRRQITPDEV